MSGHRDPEPVSEPSLAVVRELAVALGLAIPDADLERLRPEIASLRRQAARLRKLPLDISMLPDITRPR